MNPVLLKPTGERSSQVIVMGRPLETQQAADYQKAKAGLVDVVDASAGRAPLEVRRGDLRGRRQPGRDQPARPRPREPGPGRRVPAFPRWWSATSIGAACSPTSTARWRCCPRTCAGASRASSSTGSGATPNCSATPWTSWRPAAVSPRWVSCPTFPVWCSMPRTPCTGCSTPAPSRPPPAAGGSTWWCSACPDCPTSPTSILSSSSPDVAVRFVDHPSEFGDPDLVVLPGTKSTVSDLEWLRAGGLLEALEARRAGPSPPVVLGVCGGFQMLGRAIEDPDAVESSVPSVPGLGWLPVVTRFVAMKTTQLRTGYSPEGSAVTRLRDPPRPDRAAGRVGAVALVRAGWRRGKHRERP